jgi:RNA polymerase sigma factor (sigma-70 family)
MTLASTRYSLLLWLADVADHAAWTEFLEVYEPVVYSVARRRGLQDADARDLCQEVFRAVAGAARRFDPSPEKGSFRAWLFTITRNLLSNVARREQCRVPSPGGSDFLRLIQAQAADDEHSRFVEHDYQRQLLQFAAESIQHEFVPKTWQAFWRTAIEQQPVSRVASELSLSAGAVYIARSRVLARLRSRVAEIQGEDGFAGEDCA